MGRPPVALCVVRHANRLDAADKRWHLTSPTPYDPPITYGGWLQSKALGYRIAEHLRQEIEEREKEPSRSASPESKRRRYQVVIHSSPFLRCIQTSIAISAGLAQNPLPVPSSPTTLSPVMGPSYAGRPPPSIQKAILRLDACFGEWLSPEYFEMITPPPNSVMMLGTAKAELLRREDYHNYPHFHVHTRSNSSRLWEPLSSSSTVPEQKGLDDLLPLDKSLPNNEVEEASSRKSLSFLPYQEENVGYIPPTLGYSTSYNAPIPMGLVAHAKDECVDVDYQWDSMREPLNWGDGGSFGEEWTAMHKRFRRGLQSLVDWYATAENPGEMVTKTVACPRIFANGDSECAVEDPDDIEIETFVIIVSHGAGCNALIGAITRKPALMDVGLASLTLAVRKDHMMRDTTAAGETERAPIAINELYDLRLFANTEHIRPSTGNTPNSSRSPSMANALSGARGRLASFSSSNNFLYLDSSNGSRSSSANAAFGNFRRGGDQSSSIPRTSGLRNSGLSSGITVGSGVTSFTRNAMTPSGLSRHPSVGLWSPFRSGEDDVNDDEGDSMVLNFSHEKDSPSKETNDRQAKESSKSGTFPSSGSAEATDHKPQLKLGAGAGGLWGSPSSRPASDADLLRELGTHKRRWTVNERSTS